MSAEKPKSATKARAVRLKAETSVAPSIAPMQGSDKYFWHRFTAHYERAFATLPQIEEILEFGVLDGESIRWLAKRFPHARIVGVDILDPKPSWPQGERIDYYRLDQGDRQAVKTMFATLDRRFDLIIEDGSHIPQHQAACLIEGFPFMQPKGLFIVEDIHSSHPANDDFRSFAVSGAANGLHVLLAMQHLKDRGKPLTETLARDLANPAFFSPEDLMRLFGEIADYDLFKRTSLPLRCYRCGGDDFDYKALRCRCGTDLYAAADSMTFLLRRA